MSQPVLTRIQNNQITDSTINAQYKVAAGTVTGNLFAPTLTINSNLTILGNLTVSNSYTQLNSVNTYINDPLVVFNNGYTGSPSYDIGILVNRNLQPVSGYNSGSYNTAWVWEESSNQFQGILTTETGTTAGTINNSGFANLQIGNVIAASQTLSGSMTVGTTMSVGSSLNITGASGSGNLYVAGNLIVVGNIISNLGNISTVTISGNSAQFLGNAAGFGALYAGIGSGYVYQPQTVIQASTNFNGYAQVNHQNINGGANASTDFVATMDTGTATAGYIDMGINSSGWNGVTNGESQSWAGDGYLYVQAPTSGSSGNLMIATTGANGNIFFNTGGQNINNTVMEITTSNTVVINGTALTNLNAGGALSVPNGGVGIGGGLTVLGGVYIGQTLRVNTGINMTAIGVASASVGYFTTLNASQYANITSTTASTSTTNGALIVAGGAGIAGNVNIGNAIVSGNGVQITGTWNGSTNGLTSPVLDFTGPTTRLMLPSTSGFQIWGGINLGNEFLIMNSSGLVSLFAGTSSTSYNTGAFTTAGGVGIGGAMNAYGNISTTNGGALQSLGATTGYLFNETVKTLNIGAAATTINVGNIAGSTTILGNTYLTNLFTSSLTTAAINGTVIGNVTPSTGAFTSLNVQTSANIWNSATPSFNSTSGTLQTNGIGVQGNVYVANIVSAGSGIQIGGTWGGNNYSVTTPVIDYTGSYTRLIMPSGSGFELSDAGSSPSAVFTITGSGTTGIYSTTSSVNYTQGALSVSGGVGIGGQLNVYGNITTAHGGAIQSASATTAYVFNELVTTLNIGAAATTINMGNAVGTTTVLGNLNSSNLSAVNATISNLTATSLSVASLNNAVIGNVTPSAGTFTALTASTVTAGNVIAGNVTAASFQGVIGNVTPNTGAFTTLNANGIVQITNATQATSATGTGALQVTGGASIGANLYVAGNLTVAGTTTYINTTTEIVSGAEVVAGTLTANSGTASTSTTSGALQVSGGAGITGAVYAGSFQGAIGTVAPASASFTSLSATGSSTLNTVTGASFQGAIGNATPNTGAFTTLSASQWANITGTTASTTTSTGALVVAGGAGIGGNLNAGTVGSSIHQLLGNVVIGYGNGPASALTSLEINQNNATPFNSTSALHVFGSAGVTAKVSLDSVGTNIPSAFIARTASGTATSPANVAASQLLGGFIARGFGTTQFITGNVAQAAGMMLHSEQAFTDSAQGTGMWLNVIPNGSNAAVTAISINNQGNVNVTNQLFVTNSTFLNGNVVATGALVSATGVVYFTNTTTSTSTSTGALQVSGGVGVAGSVYAGAVYDAGSRVVSTSSGAGNLTISGNSISLPTTGPGATTVGSASAVPVVTTDAYGRIVGLTTASLSGSSLTGTVNTANVAIYSEIAASSTNATFYPAFYNETTGNATAFTNSSLTFNPSTGAFAATSFSGSGATLTGILGTNVTGTVATANAAIYTGVTNTSTGTYYPVLSSQSTTGNVQEAVNSSLSYNAATGALTATSFNGVGTFSTATTSSTFIASGNIVAGASTATNNNTTGALVVPSGGVAVYGNINVGGQQFIGASAQATVLTNALTVERGTSTTGAGVQYTQHALINATNTGSSDFVAYANNYPGPSTDHGWVDVGFTGDAFNDTNYSITKPNDAYLFGSAANATVGGNLVLATDYTGSFNDIVIGVGSFSSSAEVARFHGNVSNNGTFTIKLPTNASPAANVGALQVWGGASFSGNVYHGGASVFNGTQTAGNDVIVKGANDSTLVWARPNGTYDQVLIGNNASVSTLVRGAKLQINTTDTILLPVGSSAQRPTASGNGTDTAGMFRYSSTSNAIEWYNGSSWQGASSQFTIILEQQFTGDGVTTAFTLSESATTASCIVAINGIMQIGGASYAYTVSGTTLTFSQAPASTDIIDVRILTTTTSVTSLQSSTGWTNVSTSDTAGIVFQGNANSAATTLFTIPDNGGLVSNDANVSVASANTPTTFDSFSTTAYRTAKYIVQVTNGTNYQSEEVLVVQNGTTASVVTYGVVQTGGNLGVVSATLSGTTVSVQFTAANATNNVRTWRQYLPL